MAIDWDANLLAPLHGVFGESVVYQPTTGIARQLTGVFDDGYQARIQLEDGSVGWTTQEPMLGIRVAEWGATPKQGESITIPRLGRTFLITDARSDSHGEVRLTLGAMS